MKHTTDKLKSEEKRKRIEENRIKYEVPEGVWSAIELPKPELVVSFTPFILLHQLLNPHALGNIDGDSFFSVFLFPRCRSQQVSDLRISF